ncbi:hypothetical protein OROMI_011599 [Orobanche minor]
MQDDDRWEEEDDRGKKTTTTEGRRRRPTDVQDLDLKYAVHLWNGIFAFSRPSSVVLPPRSPFLHRPPPPMTHGSGSAFWC